MNKFTKTYDVTIIIPNTHKKIGWPDNYINANERKKNEIQTL